MKTFFAKHKKVALLFILIFCFTAAVSAQQNRAVTWTLALQNFKTGDMVPFGAPVQSWIGEQFRLVIRPDADCFCYVIYESPTGDDVAVLYSGPLKRNEFWYSMVLELEPPAGSESFFIVTSRDEQRTLSQRITAFKSNSNTVQRRALMNEVFRIRTEASRLREAPEKPVLMGGASRGSSDRNQGVEYSGLDIYVKTISIEH